MYAIIGALFLSIISTINTPRTYYQVNQAFQITLAEGASRELVLLTPENIEIKRFKIPDSDTEIDLNVVIPDIWSYTQLHYIQMVMDGKPTGTALVLQPLVNPARPVLKQVARGGQTIPVVQGWAEPTGEDLVMSGFRVYNEQYAVLHTTLGDITLALRPDEAPNTVWNFRELIIGGFYTQIPFHRILAKGSGGYPFVIQAGDPSATGSGGCAYNIDLEPSNIPHDLGVISMAREGQDVNTAGSQFFICLSREGTNYLDVQYTSFGHTIDGLDTIKKLSEVPVNNPSIGRPIEMPYITSAEMIDATPRVPGTPPVWITPGVSNNNKTDNEKDKPKTEPEPVKR